MKHGIWLQYVINEKMKLNNLILALKTAYDEKSLFPPYIRDFEQKMKNYHIQALSNQQQVSLYLLYIVKNISVFSSHLF